MLIKTNDKKSREEEEYDGLQPIPTSIVSNGECPPIPQTAQQKQVETLVEEMAAERAKKLGVSRRSFMRSSAGTATALYALNSVYGCGDDDGGGFAVDECATIDEDAARESLAGDYFIMDVQTHHAEVDYHKEAGLEPLFRFFRGCPSDRVDMFLPEGYECTRGELDELSRSNYIKEVLVDSETSIAVMSGIPAPGEALRFISNSEMAATRDYANQMGASERCISQGMVTPNIPAADNMDTSVDNMEYLVEELGIRAVKTYTAAGGPTFSAPNSPPWWLDDEDIAYPMFQKCVDLGINVVATHKGLNISFFDPDFLSPRDIPKAAADWPELAFVIYHSALDVGFPHENNFELFLQLAAEGQLPSNVYPELGSSFGSKVASGPIETGHFLGKLLLAFGEDNIVWGTDAIFNGTPQWQINAMKTFQMPRELQEEFGYPEITDEMKAKIFGLNSAGLYGVDVDEARCTIPGDTISMVKADNAELGILEPSLRTYGPKTRREFLRLKKKEGFPVKGIV